MFESPKTSTDLGMRFTRSARIRYVPGFKHSWHDVALGSIGFGSALTRLSGMFHRTGGQPLDEILRQFWLRTA